MIIMSNNYRWVSTLVFCLIVGFLSAQSKESVKVQLENGHTLVGELVDYIPEVAVTIRFGGGNILEIPMSDIKKLDMEGLKLKRPYTFRERGWYNRSSISALTGESGTGISINHTVSYHLNRLLGIGIGVGIDNYYKEDGYNIFPVYGEVKSFFLKKNETPFASLRVGYTFAGPDEEIGQIEASAGYMVNPALGYRLSGGGFMVDLTVGVKIQKSDYEYLSGDAKVTDNITYRRVEIGMGFMF
jgi:hypothetical protein